MSAKAVIKIEKELKKLGKKVPREKIAKTFKGKPKNTKAELALHMSLTLAALYFSPNMYGTFVFQKFILDNLGAILGREEPFPPKIASSIATTHWLLSNFFPDRMPGDLMAEYFPKLVEQYGSIAYAVAPLSVLGYYGLRKMTDNPAANDFCELMSGMADEEKQQKYSDCWMTQDISTLSSRILNWAFGKKAKEEPKPAPESETEIEPPFIPRRSARLLTYVTDSHPTRSVSRQKSS